MSDKVFTSSLSLDDCRDALEGGLDYDELDSVARALLVHCDAARRGVVTEMQHEADLDQATHHAFEAGAADMQERERPTCKSGRGLG